jgi:hypothetical protein
MAAGLPIAAGNHEVCEVSYQGVKFCPHNDAKNDNPWTSNTAQTIYGILGLFVMVPGTIYTYHKMRQRRKTLAQYLQEVEATYAASKKEPTKGLTKLTDVRQELRARYEKGRLEDAQFLELDRRIGEYVGRLRMREVERRFPDLPAGLWPEIRHVVQDGQLTVDELASVERRAMELQVPLGLRQDLLRALRQWALDAPAEPRPAPAAKPYLAVLRPRQ